MNIQPQYIKFADLLSSRLFRIPQYQRAYSWGTKQRKDLFNDIQKSYSKKNATDHFMATIVGLRRDEKVSIITDEYQFVDIVDGQQRITTLILLLKAIGKALDNHTDNVEKRIYNEIRETLVKPDKTSLLLLQTNHDTSNYFANYLRKGICPNPDSAKILADRQILMAIKECEDFVRDWQAEGGSLTNLYGHLKNRLTFIFHDISDERLVYTVFEVLNSRGLEVSWFDRLKSMLMSVVFEAHTGNKNEIIKEVHQLWADIYRTIGLRLGLRTESLRFAATLQSGSSVSKVLSEERAAYFLLGQSKEDPTKVIETTEWIKSVTEAVDKITKDHRSNAVTRISQARLVAVAVNLRSDLTEDEKERVLRRWENVTFRIYGMYAKDARTAVGSYVRLAWQIEKHKLPINDIMKKLSDIGQKYPSDKAVEELRQTDCYTNRSEELRYIFFRYEEFLAKKAGQNFDNEQWNRIWESSAANSIEHIQPKSTELPYVHWLGNLMILPPRLNSKLWKKPPKDKASEYTKTGLLIAQDVAKQSSVKWEKREVKEREEKLLEWAVQEWAD